MISAGRWRSRGLRRWGDRGRHTAAQDGTWMRVDPVTGRIEWSGRTFSAQPFPPFLEDLIQAGGLVPWVRTQLGARGG